MSSTTFIRYITAIFILMVIYEIAITVTLLINAAIR